MENVKSEIRILFIRPVLDLYGVTKVIFQLATDLRNRGHKIFFASDNQDNYKQMLKNEGILHFTLPLSPNKKNLFTFFVCLIKLNSIVKRERIDIIHSHHRWSSFISFFISKWLNIPLVSTYHGIHEGKKFLTVWGDKIISVSEHASKHLEQFFNVNSNRITVIHNGIKLNDIEETKNKLSKRESNLSNTSPIILHIARLSPEKDHRTLFFAMKLVLKKVKDVKLLLVGKGPIENNLRSQVKDLGINHNVAFIGEVRKIDTLLQRADILVLSSITEGMPMAILEAFSFSKPVVATSVGDIPKVVLNGKTGRLVPAGDPQELAKAIHFLITNKDEALRMGKNGRELIEKKFNVQNMALQTEREYINLIY